MAGGFRAPRAIVAGVPVDPNNRPAANRYEAFGLEAADTSISAPVKNRQPIAIRQDRLQGGKLRSFYEDFYDRVYVIPAAIDFGSVSVETKRQFYIWNAYRRPARLVSVNVTDRDETNLEGVVAPWDYRALELRAYDAVAREDGPASFSARYEFVFDRGDRRLLQLTGERARLLPFNPNWREGYRVSRDFKTEILVTRSGREQRRRLRQSARKAVEFSALTTHGALRALNRHMVTWQNRVVVFGEETKFARTTEAVVAGTTILPLAEIPGWLEVGVPVFVRSDFDSITTEVAAVVQGAIVLAAPVNAAMPAGTFVLKALYGRLAENIQSTRPTAAVAETDVEIEVTPGTEARARPAPLSVVLDGRPVFLLKPNWRDAPAITYVHPRETVDYDFGRTQVFTPIEFSARRMTYLFSGMAADHVFEIENLFDLMAGQAGEFYYPSWENDLLFSEALIAGTRTMVFAGSEVFDTYSGDTTHRAVAIFMADGTVYVNSLREELAFSDGKSVLTFRHEWPVTIAAGEPVMVSWLFATRFSTDKLVTEWLTREVATVKTTFVTLEDLPYDV